MTRNLKAVGAIVFSAFAMSAVAASGASASPLYHSEIENTTLTGSGTSTAMTFDLGELKCETAKFVGTMEPTTTSTMTLAPKFEKCKLGGSNAVVTSNGCNFVFHLVENSATNEATMDIQCPAGKQFQIDLSACTVKIPTQTGFKTVTFTNEGETTTRSVIADINLSEIHYEEIGFCAGFEETTTNGTYSGKITVRGEDSEENHVGVWVA